MLFTNTLKLKWKISIIFQRKKITTNLWWRQFLGQKMRQISLFVIAKARTLLLAYFQKSSAPKIANSELLYILSTVKFSLAKKR